MSESETASQSRKFEIEFEPVGRRGVTGAGNTLLSAAQEVGVQLVAVCGGIGICGSCRVRCMEGSLAPTEPEEETEFTAEELSDGWRLACRARALSDVKLDIPSTSLATAQRLQLEGATTSDSSEPSVTPYEVEVEPPGLYDLRPDWERVEAALFQEQVMPRASSVHVVQHVCDRMREMSWKGRVIVRGERGAEEIVTVLPTDVPMLGLAFDIGTTKIAGYLVDLDTLQTVSRAGVVNPQIAFGEDVVSRIACANRERRLETQLRSRLAEALNELVRQLTTGSGNAATRVVDAVVVGNTAMHHFFAGLSVRQLGEAPYVPVTCSSLSEPARDLGLDLSPGTTVYLPPNIAGYVGSDHVSALLAADILSREGRVVVLDIGTNTEISLKIADRLISCSCASGPAFEGAHIQDGMRALPGAIEHVRLSGGALHVQTVDSDRPVGICGSGILDVVASMLEAGIIDRRGRFYATHPRVRSRDGELEFLLVPAEAAGHGRDIVVTSKDVVEIQLAKGAIRAGIEILCSTAGIKSSEIDTLVVAGAFGTYLDAKSAMTVGMFPRLPEDRIEQIGNAAGTGAIRMLCSAPERQKAQLIAERAEYVELTTHPDFADVFTDKLFFELVRKQGVDSGARTGDVSGANAGAATTDQRPSTEMQ